MVALPVAAIATAIGFTLMKLHAQIGPPPDPTPLPPTILAARGQLPTGPVVFQEWARHRDGSYDLKGCGFLLGVGDGQVVGVTTAHSLSLGDPNQPLERIGLRVAGRTEFVAQFDRLHGQPGRPRTGDDLTVDYVLLQPNRPIEPDLVLQPDPRGAPQPGERVSLFNGLGGDGDGGDGQLVLQGTVQSASETAVWVLMDDWFNPALMSGSAFISQHTGQPVGMLIAGTIRGRRLLLGAHPIGSIVHLAESATEFPRLDAYRR